MAPDPCGLGHVKAFSHATTPTTPSRAMGQMVVYTAAPHSTNDGEHAVHESVSLKQEHQHSEG